VCGDISRNNFRQWRSVQPIMGATENVRSIELEELVDFNGAPANTGDFTMFSFESLFNILGYLLTLIGWWCLIGVSSIRVTPGGNMASYTIIKRKKVYVVRPFGTV